MDFGGKILDQSKNKSTHILSISVLILNALILKNVQTVHYNKGTHIHLLLQQMDSFLRALFYLQLDLPLIIYERMFFVIDLSYID